MVKFETQIDHVNVQYLTTLDKDSTKKHAKWMGPFSAVTVFIVLLRTCFQYVIAVSNLSHWTFNSIAVTVRALNKPASLVKLPWDYLESQQKQLRPAWPCVILTKPHSHKQPYFTAAQHHKGRV